MSISYWLDVYYTGYDVRCQVKSCHRGHREEEIRNTKHEIRNKSEFLMLKCSKRKGIADCADSHGLNSHEDTKARRGRRRKKGVSGYQKSRRGGSGGQETENREGG